MKGHKISITDILKATKFKHNHTLFLIAGLSIPFYLCFSVERQSILSGLSSRTVIRVKNDLLEMGVIKKIDTKTYVFNFVKFKDCLS